MCFVVRPKGAAVVSLCIHHDLPTNTAGVNSESNTWESASPEFPVWFRVKAIRLLKFTQKLDFTSFWDWSRRWRFDDDGSQLCLHYLPENHAGLTIWLLFDWQSSPLFGHLYDPRWKCTYHHSPVAGCRTVLSLLHHAVISQHDRAVSMLETTAWSGAHGSIQDKQTLFFTPYCKVCSSSGQYGLYILIFSKITLMYRIISSLIMLVDQYSHLFQTQ